MNHPHKVEGFSQKSKDDKIEWIQHSYLDQPSDIPITSYWHSDESTQKTLEGFSENTITNFHLPYGIAPNFLIDGEYYAVPMVIEESSVVAAAASAAKYWSERGGFHTEIIGTTKLGHVHFLWGGSLDIWKTIEADLISHLKSEAANHCHSMEARGGGVQKIELIDLTSEMTKLFQLKVSFETCDSMGANFINTVLECFAGALQSYFAENDRIPSDARSLEVIMSILSNFTPDCIVKAWVSCPIEKLGPAKINITLDKYAERFYQAVRIAEIDPYRATTHNKGIYNGIDAVILATGNDFRAVEACGHTYASQGGRYKSLSTCKIEDGVFYFELKVPFAVGTVGGLTKLHPLAKYSLDLLRNPPASRLMSIVASVGLAQNFGAVRSLVTTGIQKGHMQMHLQNAILQCGGSLSILEEAKAYFADKTVSMQAVKDFIKNKPLAS